MHSAVLLRKQVAKLQAANEAATRCKLHKRKRVLKGGTLTFEEGVRLTTLKEFSVRSDGKKGKKRARINKSNQHQRRCRRCGETGHNSHTCKKEAEIVLE